VEVGRRKWEVGKGKIDGSREGIKTIRFESKFNAGLIIYTNLSAKTAQNDQRGTGGESAADIG
jgi:hypothetical protein